jgi:hypothetical protein
VSSPLGRSALLCLTVLGFLATCGPIRKDPQKNGEGCSDAVECVSNHCVGGYCSQCEADSDCGEGNKCGRYPRVVGPPGGPYCVSRDAGCASTPDQCPEGFSCTGCDAGAGYACHDTTGECYSFKAPPPPQCGQYDESRGFDAGNTGPPPDVSGSTCYTCVGCPRGSSCVCGASGLVGGLRCDDVGTALACFATGGVGSCRIFPDDCNSNAQCTGTNKLCNKDGRCTQCLRDADCPLLVDGGATGCIQGKCYGCCTSDSQCPASGPTCVKGFCYACSAYDGGRCGPPPGPDGGNDGGSDGGSDGGNADGGSSDGGTDGGDGG